MQKVLYISYDGMTDPLGQSQVIPYIAGLSTKGVSFHLISFEKSNLYKTHKHEIENLLSLSNITWHPLVYTKSPPILSTLWDIFKLMLLCKKLYREYNFKLVHCRGYITSLVGLRLKRKYGIKFIFDMRAFYADERVDGKLWPQNKYIYRKVYNFFKKKELDFINSADYIISLTTKGKEIIEKWEGIKSNPLPIQVIPCCVNLDLFDPEKIADHQKSEVKKKLNIKNDQKILSYIGSIGTWYLPDEMMRFFNRFRQQFSDAIFLFITGENKQVILSLADKYNVPQNSIRVVRGMHTEVPLLLSVSDYSVFFIKPVFSKSGSSPTKMGEIMALGIPLICNSGVGDVDLIMAKSNCGFLINDFSDSSSDSVINKITATPFDKEKIRSKAFEYYSLDNGIELYWGLYTKLLSS